MKVSSVKKTIKHVKRGTKTFKIVKNYVFPWSLVAFGAAAYYIFDVPIPEHKKRKIK